MNLTGTIKESKKSYIGFLSLVRFVWPILLSLFLISCVDQSGGRKKSSASSNSSSTSSSGNSSPTPSTLPQALNFFQMGSQQTNTILSLPGDYDDSFLIRGNEINTFLTSNPSTVQCLVMRYSTSTGNKLAILAAIPKFFNNLSTGEREYYFYVQSTDEAINKANCQATALLAKLNTLYPAETAAYIFSNVCPTCSATITSDPIALYSVSGTTLPNITTSYLKTQLGEITATPTTGSACIDTTQCTPLGYNCCMQGQCVNDGQVRASVDTTSTAFAQAQSDVSSNPANFINYPDIYYVCGTVIPPTPVATATPDAIATATVVQERLKELADCINVDDDEENICTKRFPLASTPIAMGGTGTTFIAEPDDLNFTTIYAQSGAATGVSSYNITEVTYAGETLYTGTATSALSLTIGGQNDTLSNYMQVTVTHTPAPDAPNDTLKLKYRIDGSCEKVSGLLARCTKYYIQGQDKGKVNDHSSASQNFHLPAYADLTKIVTVKVDGATIPNGTSSGTTWELRSGAPLSYVTFSGGVMTISSNQEVQIDYFASLSTYPNLTTSRESAIETVKTYCNCYGNGCTLKGVEASENSAGTPSAYECVYPTPTLPEPPLQQSVVVDSKSVPIRYFDQNGVSYDDIITAKPTPLPEEGTEFSYLNSSPYQPTNTSTYVGWHEVYGTLKKEAGYAKPPKVVDVKKGRVYDIFTDTGFYSTCADCGSDYYSSIRKMFPDNFFYRGGGYRPDYVQTDRFSTTYGESTHRHDDFRFGRACWVPMTMIPWTHKPASTLQVQRTHRLEAQHFLFANGYQRDWYGFDYGALIGSFDGSTWFAIGNQRRITAKSNKLYLAVNSHFGDLTTQNSFEVTISEASFIVGSGSQIEDDIDSDGAECQQFHICSTDADCIRQLGYDYSCQNVSGLRTSWPVFDTNGNEIANITNSQQRIIDLIGGTAGFSKRCVYRGKGAPCETNFASTTATANYTLTAVAGHHACSSNNRCQSLAGGNYFNNKINRFAASAIELNNPPASVTPPPTTDEFGLATRIVGRPYNFNGTDAAVGTTNLNANQVDAICIPGRDRDQTTFVASHTAVPTSSSFKGDKVVGMGHTSTSATFNPLMLAQCGILDTDGDYYYLENPTTNLSGATGDTARYLAGTQFVSLQWFQALASATTIENLDIIKSFMTLADGEHVKAPNYQDNICLRAPGSPCFSDFECGPSKFLATQAQTLTDSDLVSGVALRHELEYWQEGLVCGQPAFKDRPDYDLKNNRCCREIGNLITAYTDETGGYQTAQVRNTAWVQGLSSTVMMNQDKRYSRIAPAFYKMMTDSTNYPALIAAHNNASSIIGAVTTLSSANRPTLHPAKQFKTLHQILGNTSCSEHWIRNFSDDNGGGHQWGPAKMQTIDKSGFKCIDWDYPEDPGAGPFACLDPETSDCRIRNLTTPQQESYLEHLANFELTGIPQILIKSSSGFSEVACTTDTSLQINPSPSFLNIPGTTKDDDYEAQSTSSQAYYKASDMNNFESTIKQVFSSYKFSSCLPADGTTWAAIATDEVTVTADMCCTGTLGSDGRCCLPDFSNVSVYYNRYVSSAGAHLPDSAFDSETGYILNSEVLKVDAALNRVCCSDNYTEGKVVGDLPVPGHLGSGVTTNRFIYSNNPEDNQAPDFNASYYDAGVRWNNHLYCDQ